MSGYWICCSCDAPLSCDSCGVEQPDDSDYFDAIELERNNLRAALAPFIAVSDQSPSEMAKIIHKGLDGLTPITVTVTKQQFMAALKLCSPSAVEREPRTAAGSLD